MNLIESFLGAAAPDDLPESQRTTYFMSGKIVYADEIYSADGFMPLLGRMAERKLARVLNSDALVMGLEYVPHKATIFGETCFAKEAGPGVFEDSVRLPALMAVAESVLGLGYRGAVDITPVYDYFMGLTRDARDKILQAEDEGTISWPLFKVFPAAA